MADTPSPDTPAASTPPQGQKVVTIGRTMIAINVLIQLAVVFALVVMVNYLSFRHFKRWDYSRDQRFVLSSQTKALLGSLPKPVKAVIFFSGGSEIAPDVQGLLREYEYASNKKFSTEIVDAYRNFTRAQELQAQYKFGSNENIVILDYDGRSKFVNAADMAEMEQDQMGMMLGQGPRVKAFKGEQALTSALVELVEGKPNKVYYLTGHGEPPLNSPELKTFERNLKRQNIQIAPLTLLNENSVPEDARAIVLNSAKLDISELEVRHLTAYWEKRGRIFVILEPDASTPRLHSWLGIVGIVPVSNRVVKTGLYLTQGDDGNPSVQNGVIKSPVFVVLRSSTSITKDLEEVNKQFMGSTQSLDFDRTKETTAKSRFIPLLQSGKDFWGETDFNDASQAPFFDPKRDRMGPLPLAYAVEMGAVADQRVKVDTSRMVAVGNGALLSDSSNRLSEGVTMYFTMNALNWLLDREEMVGIPAKEKTQITIRLDDLQMNRIKLLVLVAIPGVILLAGFANWLSRRS